MTDTEILDWIVKHASKLGIKPDFAGWTTNEPYIDTTKPDVEHTDIRKRVEALAASSPNNVLASTDYDKHDLP